MGNLRVRVRKISFSFVLQIFLRSVMGQPNSIGLLINSDQTCTQGNQVIYIGEFPFAKFRFPDVDSDAMLHFMWAQWPGCTRYPEQDLFGFSDISMGLALDPFHGLRVCLIQSRREIV